MKKITHLKCLNYLLQYHLKYQMKYQMIGSFILGVIGVPLGVSLGISLGSPLPAFAAATSNQDMRSGAVSLSFDDGYEVVYQYALPLFKKYGITGTAYITTGAVGQPGFMTWDQIRELEKEGWEIQAHSVTHPIMEKIPLPEARDEGVNSLGSLHEHGFKNACGLAFPYGSYNPEVIAELAKTFSFLRGFWDRDDFNASDTLNSYLLQVQAIDRNTSLDKIKGWLKKAKDEKKNLSLVFHDLELDGKSPTVSHLGVTRESNPRDYFYTYDVATLEQALKAIQESGLPAVTDGQVATLKGTRILHSAFSNSNTTDAASLDWTQGSALKIDQEEHGNYPSAKMSVALSSTESPSASIDDYTIKSKRVQIAAESAPENKYIFQGYFNQLARTEGSMIVEVQEFDHQNQPMGSVKLAEVATKRATMVRRPYQPTSTEVGSFQVKVYPKDLKGTVYLDEFTLVQN